MKNNIQEILQELYEIDNSLQKNEVELEKVIMKMLAIQPNVKVDANFKKELQYQIQEKILQKKLENYGKNKLSIFQIFSYIFGTVGMACFGFILLKDNIYFSSPPQQTSRIENTFTERKMMMSESQDMNIMNDALPTSEI